MKLMTKIKAGLISLAAIGMLGVPMMTHASAYTQVGQAVTPKDSTPEKNPYHYSGNKNVYMWNKAHTQKLHNLKNYRKITFYLDETVVLKHNGKKAVYYKLSSITGKVRGYVWRGFVKKGFSSKGYHIVQRKWGLGTYEGDSYYPKANQKHIYGWDYYHNKKRVDFTKYPSAQLRRRHTAYVMHNGKKSVYYAVEYLSKDHQTYHYAYVWRGFLNKGDNPNHEGQDYVSLDRFVSSKDFNEFIKTGPKQNLARQVVKSFDMPVDLELSDIGATNYDFIDVSLYYLEDHYDADASGYTDFIHLKDLDKKLRGMAGASDAVKLATIKSEFNKAGYTPAKLKQLKAQGYRLGVYILDNLYNPNRTIVEETENDYVNFYSIVLAKKA